MNQEKSILGKALFDAIAATLMVTILGYTSYLMLEPMAGFAATTATSQFVVNQQITAEVSFLVNAANVTLAAIGGITGGDSEGYTGVRVYTNDRLGFTMTITASNSPAMLGSLSTGTIPNYAPASANVPDFTFASTTSGQAAQFGYTITASSTSDLAQKFKDNGTTCNTGSADTNGKTSCWYNLSTTATSTMVTSAFSNTSGASSTLFFRVHVPANPSPAVTDDTYFATSTLTATAN